jgi:hypothetical protein
MAVVLQCLGPLGLYEKQISVQEVGEVIVSFLVNFSA